MSDLLYYLIETNIRTIIVFLYIELLLGCIFGWLVKKIGAAKGYYYGCFAMGFWAGIIGVVVILSKPNLKEKEKQTQVIRRRLELNWTCSCGTDNEMKYEYCIQCGTRRREILSYRYQYVLDNIEQLYTQGKVTTEQYESVKERLSFRLEQQITEEGVK